LARLGRKDKWYEHATLKTTLQLQTTDDESIVLGWLVNRGKELAMTTNRVECLDVRAKNLTNQQETINSSYRSPYSSHRSPPPHFYA